MENGNDDSSSNRSPDDDDVVETMQFDSVKPGKSFEGDDVGIEDGKWEFEDDETGLGVLFDDGLVQLRVSEGEAKMLTVGGSIEVGVPDDAETVQVVVRDDPPLNG